ncbi:hypothetical protein N9887_01465 [Flavobacteriaceae bacterium]|nr:hypothetical protein [Flavobacteriaceae bacterium]
MRNLIFLFFLIFMLSNSSGQTSEDSFLVTDISVGIFKKGMTVSDLLELVENDQIKKVVDHDGYENTYDDYQYYDSDQNHLLTLTPENQNDKNSKINRVLIIDKRYKTDQKVGLSSTYIDLKDCYLITNYEPDLEHIVLRVKELNAWFSINKSQLLENWWDDSRKRIDKSKIPDKATFDSFVIWWN